LLIKPEKDDPNPLVIYHGKNCPDGFASALAAWLFYQGKAEFLGLDHGVVKSVTDLPKLDGRAVYILDFSFSAEILLDIEQRAAKLVLLDHHKSAADKLTGFACRCGVVYFDMQKSGARLAWEFFSLNASCLIWCGLWKTAISGPGSIPRARAFWPRWTWSRLSLHAGTR
jgi:oligoribonuclease NrnB/cAMP/cGMP phosphodiesterase (DHH superfamily)